MERANWLRLGLGIGLLLSFGLQFFRAVPPWPQVFCLSGVVLLIFALAQQLLDRFVPTGDLTPARSVRVNFAETEPVVKPVPAPIGPRPTGMPSEPPPFRQLPPAETVPRLRLDVDPPPAETVLRVSPAQPALEETVLRMAAVVEPARLQTVTLASLSLPQAAELHARAYQIQHRLAQGSSQQAEGFRNWLNSHRCQGAALAQRAGASVSCPQVILATPTGKISWRELRDLKYRFLILSGENGYLIPRMAPPLPNISEFTPPAQPAVHLESKA